MKTHVLRPVLLAGTLFALFACERGAISEKPPIHLNPNMDIQPKYKPQRESHFFADGRSMRTPPEGTVARGMLREDDALYRGKNADGSYVSQAPISKSDATLARGEERYGIYCVPCHGASGLGDGIVIKKGFPIPPPTFWDPRVMAMADGEIFNIISEGVRNMPSYKAQISIEDRWHIILYLRGLQSQPAPSKEAQE